MRTAVLGTGRMGTALAERLLSGGHEVCAWNRTSAKSAGLVAAGAREAASIADAARGAEVVISSLTDDAAVRSVALGDGGLRGCLGDETTYVECSTVSPQLTEELAGVFPSFVAMPVLGGPAAVGEGHATYLAGGTEAALGRLGPLLPCLGGPVRRYPSPGLASTAKLAANLFMLSSAVAVVESLSVGRAGGLSEDQLRELLEGALPPGLKSRFEGLRGAPWSGWWSVALGAKDAGLAMALASNRGYELRVGPAAREAYLRAAADGYGGEDIAAVRHVYEP
jgi:3-hydroxyisobutyrate dehydrogenase-like beta-hydroxyacid dehydrogenase